MATNPSLKMSSSEIPNLQTTFSLGFFGAYKDSIIELVPGYIESSSSSISSVSSISTESSSDSSSSTRRFTSSSLPSTSSSISSVSSSTIIATMVVKSFSDEIEIISPSIHRNKWTKGPYLQSGKTYKIVCDGVYTKWGLSDWFEQGSCPGGQFDGFSHDSFFMYAYPIKWGCPPEQFPIRVRDIAIRLDGSTQEILADYFTGEYDQNHNYEIKIEGQGGFLEAKIIDDYVDDNMGEIYMEVHI